MFSKIVLISCIYFAILTPYLARAMTEDQRKMIHEHFENLGIECMKEFPVSADDIKEFRSKKMATGENAPCFVACVMKKIGVMDVKGMMQKESALEMAKAVFQDEEELKSIEEFLHHCSSVNEASVSDGEKGCDRAKMAFNCMVENASNFGFDI